MERKRKGEMKSEMEDKRYESRGKQRGEEKDIRKAMNCRKRMIRNETKMKRNENIKKKTRLKE